jgi:S-formylglutathione hydrolase FrmB
MTNKWRQLGVLAIGAAMQAGLAGLALAQGAPATPMANPPPPGAEGYQGGNIGEPVVTSPTEAEPGTELPVLYVTSVEVARSQTQPQLDIVEVTGLVGSQGWSSP